VTGADEQRPLLASVGVDLIDEDEMPFFCSDLYVCDKLSKWFDS